MQSVGITDHFATAKLPDRYQVVQLDRYLDALTDLKQKYRNSGCLLQVGLEVDFSRLAEPLLARWDFDRFNELDYILFEYVDDREWDGRSLADLEALVRDQLRVPVGLAHNDVMTNYDLDSTDAQESFTALVKRMGLFLEFNEGEMHRNKNAAGKNYFETIPGPLLAKWRDANICFSIGTDAHRLYELDRVENAAGLITSYNLPLLFSTPG